VLGAEGLFAGETLQKQIEQRQRFVESTTTNLQPKTDAERKTQQTATAL